MNNKKDIKVLIVDDDVVDQKALKRQIKSPKRDVEIVDVTSGKEAIDLIKTHRFDCIFLDYMLPDMDGISVLKSIYNKKTGLGPCPVIMLTGQGSQAVVIDAIRYGAQDYLVKENLSRDTLMIAMTKAQEMFDLKLTQSKSEETLLRSQKMEAIGQLTGGIAHDFNNLLTIMFGNLRLMDDALKRDEFDKELCRGKIEKVEKAARRGADLVKRLMLFSRQRALDPVTTDLNEAMIEAQSLLERAVGGSVEIKLFPSEGLWPVNIDPGELEHAIINLGINARDAMPDGGVLTIETENITVIDDDYQTSHDLEAGDYVLISVSDTGSGMDEQTKEKIFDPFFTTKDVGQGTGLGLSMVYGFIRDTGGQVAVYSELGIGTCFRIYLPKAQSDIEFESKPTDGDVDIRGGSETILVVEDEPDILDLTTSVLSSKGYNILSATNADDALSIILDDKEKKIDLLFTDIAMPGEMSGIQLAARVLALDPNMNVLFTTGYTKQSLPDYGLIEGNYQIISKPYQYAELFGHIREVLD